MIFHLYKQKNINKKADCDFHTRSVIKEHNERVLQEIFLEGWSVYEVTDVPEQSQDIGGSPPLSFLLLELHIHIILPSDIQITSTWKIKMNSSSVNLQQDWKCCISRLRFPSITVLNAANIFPITLTPSKHCVDLDFALLCHTFLQYRKTHGHQQPYVGRKIFLNRSLAARIPLWVFC